MCSATQNPPIFLLKPDRMFFSRTKICPFLFLVTLLCGLSAFSQENGQNEAARIRFPQVYQDVKVDDQPVPDEMKELGVLFHTRLGAQFAGFLVALEEGYYRDENLPPVKIYWVSDETSAIREHRLGHIQFSSISMARCYHYNSLGSGLVVIAVMCEQSETGIMVNEGRFPNIQRVEDFEGHSIGVYFRDDEMLRIVLKELGISAETVPLSGTGFDLLRKRAIDGLYCSAYDTGALARYTGYPNPYHYFPIETSGVKLPNITMHTSRSFLMKHPEICRKFIRTSYCGWAEAFRDKEKTIAILKKYYTEQQIPFIERVVRDQLDAWERCMSLSALPEENGNCSEEAFDRMRDLCIRAGIVEESKAATYNDFFFPVMQPETMERIHRMNESEGAAP